MSDILMIVLYSSLMIHVVLLCIAAWKVWMGENIIDRLVGLDLVGTVNLAIFVLLAMIFERTLYVDVALALAALGFVSTLALAGYAADEKMF
jgi:multisubunit Na+/H+ antiporter MnhF subunit